MKRHVSLVGLLFMLWGAMILLIGMSLVSLGVAAAALGGAVPPVAGRLSAGILAAAFFMLAAIGLIFGLAHLWVGARLRCFREWARAFAIVLSVTDLVCVPFGTALGIYALWALLDAESKPLFDEQEA
jgi:hypothetical protein